VTADLGIQTCSESLLNPGTCCVEGCDGEALVAIIDFSMVEHTRCGSPEHVDGAQAKKPLKWNLAWGPSEAR